MHLRNQSKSGHYVIASRLTDNPYVRVDVPYRVVDDIDVLDSRKVQLRKMSHVMNKLDKNIFKISSR